MKTGLTKKQKRTSIYFTEADEFLEICTYNTELKTAWRPLQRNIPQGAANWMMTVTDVRPLKSERDGSASG